MYPTYKKDFYGWAMHNSQLLKQGKYGEADIEHIIEELEEIASN